LIVLIIVECRLGLVQSATRVSGSIRSLLIVING